MELGYAEALQSASRNPYRRGTTAPPNRLDTGNFELLWELRHSWRSSSLEELRREIKELTGAKYVFFAPSGRCALANVLSLLPQAELVMPAYTCPVVKTAVEFAGKRIQFVDISRQSLNSTSMEYEEEAREGRILLPTHLFGIPTDIENICVLGRRRGCITIEDAAAALVGRSQGRRLGTFADIGIFSFERSKRFPAFRGGAILINNDSVIDPEALAVRNAVPTWRRLPVKELVFAQLYNAATEPWIYGRFVLPSLLRGHAQSSASGEPGDTPNDSPYYQGEFHPYQAAIVLRSLRRRERIREHIQRLVSTYDSIFRDTGIRTFVKIGDDQGGLLRYPIIVPGMKRAELLRQTLSRGLYLETNYEQPLPARDDWNCFPNSLWAAKNVVLLPLYRRLSVAQAEDIATKVADIARNVCPNEERLEEPEYATHLA